MNTYARTIPVIHMSDNERDVLASAINQFFSFGTDVAVDDAIVTAKFLIRTYAPDLYDAVERFSVEKLAALVVKNVPYDSSVTTGIAHPEIAVSPKSNRYSEALLLGLSGICGKPYGVETEGRGVIANLCPIWSQTQALTGLGSRKTLGLHIENALLRRLSPDSAPDGLALIGVADEPEGGPATFISDARLALAAISGRYRSVLRQENRYFLKLPQRWRRLEQPQGIWAPIVTGSGEDENYAFAFYGDMVMPRDQEAKQALSAFRAALEKQAVAVHIRPGSLALINNHVAAHGRAAFAAGFSPAGLPYRWLQRVFWISDYQRLENWQALGNGVFRPSDHAAPAQKNPWPEVDAKRLAC